MILSPVLGYCFEDENPGLMKLIVVHAVLIRDGVMMITVLCRWQWLTVSVKQCRSGAMRCCAGRFANGDMFCII